MVVRTLFPVGALLFVALASGQSAPQLDLQFVPDTLPCASSITLTLPQGQVIAGSVTSSVNKLNHPVQHTDGTKTYTIDLTPKTDCGQKLEIVAGKFTQSIGIAPALTVDASPKQGGDGSGGVVESPSMMTLYAAPVAALAALMACILTGTMLFLQRRAWRLANASREDLRTMGNALAGALPDFEVDDPLPKFSAALASRIERVIANGKFGKDPSTEEKHSKLVGKLITIETLVGNVMNKLVKMDSGSVVSGTKMYPSTHIDSSRSESVSYPQSPDTSSAGSDSAYSTSFEDAYNNAAPGTEDRLPGVSYVVAVNPREVADKNPNAKEPLIEDPSGALRVFTMQSGELYLAPSLEMRAEGIGGTYQRPWAYLFTFEGVEPAKLKTRLKRAATVRREDGQYVIVNPGVMA